AACGATADCCAAHDAHDIARIRAEETSRIKFAFLRFMPHPAVRPRTPRQREESRAFSLMLLRTDREITGRRDLRSPTNKTSKTMDPAAQLVDLPPITLRRT